MFKNLVSIAALSICLSGCFSTVKSSQKVDAKALNELKAFDYADWQSVLKSHVNEQGQVYYGALKANRVPLDRFVALMGAVGPKSRPELFKTDADKLAYYINAYNAFTMFNVINRLPEMKSVNDDLKSFFYFTEFEMDGGKISLYNLENELIRKEFNEPRIHFALNCASAGCPQLPAEAFLPETLEAQLSRETTKFIKESRNVTVENGAVVLSEIFKWYKVDFPPSPVAWFQAQDSSIKLPEGAPVRYRPYDWALNRQ